MFALIAPSPTEKGDNVMSASVCVARAYLKNHSADVARFYVHFIVITIII